MTKNLKRGIGALAKAVGMAVLAMAATSANAQFIYAGLGNQLSFARLDGPTVADTFNGSIDLVPFAGYRVGKRFAVGLSSHIPLYSFAESSNTPTGKYRNGQTFKFWSNEDIIAGRQPVTCAFSLKPAVGYTLHAMLVLLERSGFFFDARIAYGGVREEFIMLRNASAGVAALDERITARRSGISPGGSLGWMPHVGKRYFFRLDIGIDYMHLKKGGVQYATVSQPSGGSLQSLTLYSRTTWGLRSHFGFLFGLRI